MQLAPARKERERDIVSTKAYFKREEITSGNHAFSQSRTTIETAFYGNNVERVNDLKLAYEMARTAPGVIETDLPVYEPEQIGLPPEAKILLLNDGETVGRFAGARVILGEVGVVESEIAKVLREAAYHTRFKKCITLKRISAWTRTLSSKPICWCRRDLKKRCTTGC